MGEQEKESGSEGSVYNPKINLDLMKVFFNFYGSY